MKKIGVALLIIIILVQGVLLVPQVRQWIGDELEARKYKVIEFNQTTLSVVDENGFDALTISDRPFREFVTENRIFMPVSFVERLGYHVYFESSTNNLYIGDLGQSVIYDTAKETMSVVGTDSMLSTKLNMINDEWYVDVQELSQYIDLTIKVLNDSQSVMLSRGEKMEVPTKAGTNIFPSPMYTYDMMAAHKDASMFITSGKIEDDFIEVLTDKLQVGYVSTSMIGDIQATAVVDDEKYRIKYPDGKKVYMFWEAVYEAKVKTDSIGTLDGVNVVSPTWYELKGVDGTIRSKVDEDYIKWAKERNYQIWALASNSFDLDLTHGLLSNPAGRKNMIDQLVTDARNYGFEGINIDFENVYLKDKDALTQFMLELTTEAHKYGIMTSIDVTAISTSENWSLCYDRKALGRIVDYMCVMSYDEYWASSPISGPVASYGWVENSMLKIAEIVDNDRLILGLPTYIRLWHETPSTEVANKMSNKSYALTMQRANELIEEYNASFVYDSVNQLYFASYVVDGHVSKMWIDNSETLGNRAKMVNQYGFGGVALWSRGFETQDVWSIIKQAIE